MERPLTRDYVNMMGHDDRETKGNACVMISLIVEKVRDSQSVHNGRVYNVAL